MHGSQFLAAAAVLSGLAGCVIQAPTHEAAPAIQQQQQSDWIPLSVATDGSSSWEAQRNSFVFAENQSNEPVGVVNGRVVSLVDNNIRLFRWHVTLNDCSRRMGELIFSDTTDAYLDSVEFAFGAGTHASRVAQSICEAAELKASTMQRRESSLVTPSKPAI